jgi:hypothetical protein
MKFDAMGLLTIDEPVYVSLPEGVAPDGKPRVWRLERTLYGLNRAPKAFYDQLTAFLIWPWDL